MRIARFFPLSGVAFFLIVLGMRAASTPTANLSYLLVAAYALLGRGQAIQALALSWLFGALNPGLVAEATGASIGRYAVLAAAAASVFGRVLFGRPTDLSGSMVWSTLLLGGALVLHSLAFSTMADVSVLKGVSWTLAMATLLAGWGGLAQGERELVERQLFGLLTLLLLTSLPLLALPIGYLVNGAGFQGVLSHPQSFGPTAAVLCAWAASRLFGEAHPSWSAVGMVIVGIVLVFLSGARTAGVALVLGVAIGVVLAPALARQSLRAVLPGLRSARLHLVILLALGGTLVAGPTVSEQVDSFIAKKERATSLAEAYELSRGELIDMMWDNISENTWTGIGFGIASIPDLMEVERDPIFEIPTSAIVEKGVLPIAVLEELGVFGFLAVTLWVAALISRVALAGVTALSVAVTVLLLNMGESTLFSPGGMGLLSLILLAWGVAAGNAARSRR